MWKKRKIDYIIEEQNDERLIFRFYPRQSSCHSFGDEPPKSWEDVCKVYYHYKIIRQTKWNPEDQWESEIVFNSNCDECSIIDDIGQRCLLLANGTEVFIREDDREIKLLDERILPFGMGVEWTITKYVSTTYGWDDDDEGEVTVWYKFMLFDYWDKGFKFEIKEEQMKSFGEYLLECCEYMLTHGNPI